MPCDTCGHTMQTILDPSSCFHWCPRCGTIKTGGGTVVEVPKLVERCRLFQISELWDKTNPRGLEEWKHLGIAESIDLPEDRPQ